MVIHMAAGHMQPEGHEGVVVSISVALPVSSFVTIGTFRSPSEERRPGSQQRRENLLAGTRKAQAALPAQAARARHMPWECASFSRLPLFDARPEPGRQVRGDGATRGLARYNQEWGMQLDCHHAKRTFRGSQPAPPSLHTTSPFGGLSTPTASFGADNMSGGLARTPSRADIWGGSYVSKGKRVHIGQPVEQWGDADKPYWANGGVRTANRSFENMRITTPAPTPWWLSASTWQTESQSYGRSEVKELTRASSAHALRTPTNQARPIGMSGL